MTTKRTFAAVPDFLSKMASDAPGGKEVVAPQMPEQPPAESKATDIHHDARPLFREREATQRMTVNMPKGLYEELRAYMKLTDVPMSEVLIDGVRRELARLRKQGSE